ncbi:hypothetical protein C8R47DRAFT_813847 [Mycena vitilis]|nr:hypothetical protein C8R47DRAFT_813847 [Mycena vitilis]
MFEGPLPELTDSEPEPDIEVDGELQRGKIERDADLDPLLEEDVSDGLLQDEPWTLIRDENRAHCNTRLCKSPEGSAWTVLKAPRSAVRLAASDALVEAIEFREKADHQRKTLRAIKENSKLYTVGPMDFCGHAKASQHGRGWLISPCHWHSSLTDNEQRRAYQSWQTIGTWKRGMQKLSKKAMRARIALQNKVRKDLKGSWRAARPMTEKDVVLEVRRQTAAKLAKQRAKNLKATKTSGLRAIKQSSTQVSDTFRSQRLNNLGGNPEGRLRLKSLATKLLGIRRRAHSRR